jgi:hypothetical protein
MQVPTHYHVLGVNSTGQAPAMPGTGPLGPLRRRLRRLPLVGASAWGCAVPLLPQQLSPMLAELRGFQGIFNLGIKIHTIWICALDCIWEDLAACKILLRGVAVICPQFWELYKMTRNREV